MVGVHRAASRRRKRVRHVQWSGRHLRRHRRDADRDRISRPPRRNRCCIRLVPPGVILPPAGTPTAAFTFSPQPATANLPVIFDASTSQAGSGASQIVSYAWTFGDGATGTGRTVTHTFDVAEQLQRHADRHQRSRPRGLEDAGSDRRLRGAADAGLHRVTGGAQRRSAGVLQRIRVDAWRRRGDFGGTAGRLAMVRPDRAPPSATRLRPPDPMSCN